MIYPEVHTLASANLRWSGVGMQGSPNATKGLTVFSSSLPTKMEDSIHYGTLGRSPNPHKAWGTHPQLNWRLPINRHQGLHKELATKASTKAWGTLHNLIGDPQKIATKASTKNTTKPYNLTNTSPPRITVENSNLCTKCKGKSFTLKFQQSYKSYWGNKRGRTKRTTNVSKI